MSNIDRMRDGYARYSDRDFSFVDETFAEDIDWRVPVSEPLVGRAAVLGFSRSSPSSSLRTRSRSTATSRTATGSSASSRTD